MTLRVRRLAAVISVGALVASALTLSSAVEAATPDVGPIFVNGQAQIVPEFADPNTWIRQQLWVETDFDTDGDGELDRMHVDVTRPAQTDGDLDVPVVYETSPYYAGTASTQSQYFWNVNHELGRPPPPRTSPPPITPPARPHLRLEQRSQHLGAARLCGGSLRLTGHGLVRGMPDCRRTQRVACPQSSH